VQDERKGLSPTADLANFIARQISLSD